MFEIGSALKNLRQELGLNQKEMIGSIASTSFYSKVERGLVEINADMLLQILVLHDVSLDNFFNSLITSNKCTEFDISNQQIKEQLELAFYNNDLISAKKLKKQVESINSQYLQLLSILIVAALQNKIEKLPEDVKYKIKHQIFKYDTFNKYTLKLFGNAMAIYPLDEMSFQVNAILYKYKNSEELTIEMQEIIASICLNFMYNCFLKKAKELIDNPLAYLKALPSKPQLFFYKLVGQYIHDYLNNNLDDCKAIKKQLAGLNYTVVISKLD